MRGYVRNVIVPGPALIENNSIRGTLMKPARRGSVVILRAAQRATGNLFLDHLPEATFQHLAGSLSEQALYRGAIIYDADQAVENVVFPINAIISVVLGMADGATAEVGIIGREGTTGLGVALGPSRSTQRAVVQVPDGGLCMTAKDFVTVVERDCALKSAIMRYAHATIVVTSQLSACNSLHPTDERCARWLLMAHDRVEGDVLPLTQEFLSQMLGVRRGGVTVAASALSEAGFISYTRGRITILDRAGLESAACECYETISRSWEADMGYPLQKTPQRVPAGRNEAANEMSA